jgi:hypothetical protein
VSPRQYIHRADHIGVFLQAAFNAHEPGLRLPVLCRHMPTGRTGPARVVWRHGDAHPSIPVELVFQLAAELEPALIEDGLVQAGLGPNVAPRYFLSCGLYGWAGMNTCPIAISDSTIK